MVARKIVAWLERQAVQFVGRVEDAVAQHAVHLEIRLDLRFAEIEARLARLVRVVRPVPGLQPEGRRVSGPRLTVDQGLQVRRLAVGFRNRCRRQRREHPVDRSGRARALVGQNVSGVVRVAQQACPLGAQPDQLGDHGGVVGVATVRAPDRGPVDPLPQRATLQLRQHRLDRRVLQPDHPLAFQCAGPGGLFGRADLLGRQTVQRRAVVDHDRAFVGRLARVLFEARVQLGDSLIQIAQPFLFGSAQTGAGPHEQRVIALRQLRGLGVAQFGPGAPYGLDAGEQRP